MISYLLAGPAEEPVTLAEAKAFLRLDQDNEDGLLATLIAAARLHVEAVAGRALLDQSWRLVLDAWPAGRSVTLPVAPARTLTAITAFDADNAPVALDLAQFRLVAGRVPACLALPQTIAGMPELRPRLGIEIDYVAGHGDAANVPADLRHAVLVLVGYWFEHRDAVVGSAAGAVVPPGLDRALAAYRQVRL